MIPFKDSQLGNSTAAWYARCKQPSWCGPSLQAPGGKALAFGGYVLLGILAIIISGLVVAALALVILPALGIVFTAFVLIAVFIALVLAVGGVVYFLGFVGAIVKAIFRPAEVKPGRYSLEQARGPGKRGRAGKKRKRQ